MRKTTVVKLKRYGKDQGWDKGQIRRFKKYYNLLSRPLKLRLLDAINPFKSPATA